MNNIECIVYALHKVTIQEDIRQECQNVECIVTKSFQVALIPNQSSVKLRYCMSNPSKLRT